MRTEAAHALSVRGRGTGRRALKGRASRRICRFNGRAVAVPDRAGPGREALRGAGTHVHAGWDVSRSAEVVEVPAKRRAGGASDERGQRAKHVDKRRGDRQRSMRDERSARVDSVVGEGGGRG